MSRPSRINQIIISIPRNISSLHKTFINWCIPLDHLNKSLWISQRNIWPKFNSYRINHQSIYIQSILCYITQEGLSNSQASVIQTCALNTSLWVKCSIIKSTTQSHLWLTWKIWTYRLACFHKSTSQVVTQIIRCYIHCSISICIYIKRHFHWTSNCRAFKTQIWSSCVVVFRVKNGINKTSINRIILIGSRFSLILFPIFSYWSSESRI